MLTLILDNALSVSQILSDVPPDCACTFFGIDGSVTSTLGVDDVDVGPPQTQVSGTCGPETPARKPRQAAVVEATATFSGAGPNPPTYSETFPANGVAQPISKHPLIPRASPQGRECLADLLPRRHVLSSYAVVKSVYILIETHSQSAERLTHHSLLWTRHLHFLRRRWQRD